MKIIPFFLLFFLFACQGDKSLVLGDLKAVGRISPDSTFEGVIKFYNLETGILKVECNYYRGKMHGNRIDYYSNGVIASKESYENGKLDGYVYFYDSNANKLVDQFYYYDLQVGPTIKYENNKEISFSYSSLDFENLFKINYDSLKKMSLTTLQKNFFFYKIIDFVDSNNSSREIYKCFIYTLNPPKLSFNYEIVQTDFAYKNISVIKKIPNNGLWQMVDIENKVSDSINSHIAIRLKVYDSIRNEKFTMFKKIDFSID